MPLSLSQLRTVPTRSQVLQWYLTQLTAVGFNASAWQEGSPQRTLLLGLSRVTTNFAEVVKDLTEFCYNDLARGAALEALSIARFGNTPKPGTKARFTVTLTNGGTVPHTVTVGQLLLATRQNVQFRSTTGGTVAAGGTLGITVEAVKKGFASTVADNTITVMVTPLAGVTATNPVGGLVASGEDPELDSALRLRNSTKWARLSLEKVRDSYIQMALQASDTVRRAAVADQNPRGAGTLDVYIAGATRSAGNDDVIVVQNAMARRVLQTEQWPASNASRVKVFQAPTAIVEVTGTVYYGASYSATDVATRVEAAIGAFIALTPIGGYPYPAPGNVLPKNNLEQAILRVRGVRTVVLTSPAADVALGAFDVATLGSMSMSYQSVQGAN